MTDKEQIIVDGVNIIDCDNYYVEQETDQVKCDLSGEYCRENKNCYYKQLANKTQECEELKSESFTREELISIQEKDIASYRKALEEIEEYIYTDCEYNDGCDRNICIRCKYSNVHDKRILDIISKAKGCI